MLPDTSWTHDATHHWHACTSSGCDGTVQDKGEHTEGQWIVDQMPTETTDGMRHKECTVCGRILKTQTLSATGLSYREIYVVIKGSNQTIQKGADRTVTIHIDGELDNFLWVKVQGMTIEEKYYTRKSGSTILTFTEEYISNLAAGTYEMTFGYTNGYGRTTLIIVDSVDSVASSQNWTNPTMLLVEGHADMPRSPKTGE
ncbi:MAG: hypothetical protein PUB98_00120 [Clostridiales bacterium]|nr:hypothetical protein [Clostridiales bacterium]